jgi:hypothetical protein
LAKERDIIHSHICLERVPYIPAIVPPAVFRSLRVAYCKSVAVCCLSEPFGEDMFYPRSVAVQDEYEWCLGLDPFGQMEFV